jgi:putative ABC transport system substrate-binding protein
MKRREFIAALGGAAVWPFAVRAQHPDRTRRIGILMSTAENDREGQSRVAALTQRLAELGWSVGRNLQIDLRWGASDTAHSQTSAAELVNLAPDLLVANAGSALAAARQSTRAIPIVFVQVTDPVGSGFVASLANPGENVTGFTSFEGSMGAKWVELLREIAPNIRRDVILQNPAYAPTNAQLMPAIESVAQSLGVQLTTTDVRDGAEIEAVFDALARETGVGVIPAPNPVFTINRKRMIALVAQHHLPAVYYFRFFAEDGGLMSYGPDTIDVYRQAASYVDRILKGAKPADLPVQNPTKYEFVLNLRTAKALGLTVPPALLARADEVIE